MTTPIHIFTCITNIFVLVAHRYRFRKVTGSIPGDGTQNLLNETLPSLKGNKVFSS